MLHVAAIVATTLAALGAAILGGVYFAFSTFIMAALDTLPHHQAARAMQAINRVILGSLFMPVFFGTAIFSVIATLLAWLAWPPDAFGPVLAAAVLSLGSFASTAAFNVPLNNRLNAADADLDAAWQRYHPAWTLWNHVRTAASLGSAVAFVVAILSH